MSDTQYYIAYGQDNQFLFPWVIWKEEDAWYYHDKEGIHFFSSAEDTIEQFEKWNWQVEPVVMTLMVCAECHKPIYTLDYLCPDCRA